MNMSLSAPSGALAPAVVVEGLRSYSAKHSQAGVRAFDVPGGHGSMLQEPHVTTIADILCSILSSAPTVAPAANATPGGQAA